MQFVTKFQDKALADFAEQLAELGENGTAIFSRALNAAGKNIRQATVAAEVAQTGLSSNTMERAQRERDAEPGRLTYTILAAGGNVSLKFFHPSEGGGGVTAHPWNRASFYDGSFMTSGRPGKRYLVSKLNGQVYERTFADDERWQEKRPKRTRHKSPIRKVQSGLFIPDEMIKGKTLAAFEAQAALAADQVVRALMTRLA